MYNISFETKTIYIYKYVDCKVTKKYVDCTQKKCVDEATYAKKIGLFLEKKK